MKISNPNIGEIIREKVVAKGLSVAQFAQQIGKHRQNVEKTVFQKHGLDTDLLRTISEVLDCNLFNYYVCDGKCNTYNYSQQEIRATLSLELGAEKKDKVLRFVFGEHNLEISGADKTLRYE